MTNVMGDSLGAGIVYELSKYELPSMEPEMHDTGQMYLTEQHDENSVTAV